MRKEIETVDYYFNRLSKNYIYKGPILEWYMRIKVGLEDNYKLFESLLPKREQLRTLAVVMVFYHTC